MPYIDSSLMKKICQNGTYYIPAWKHYNNKQANVVCDRCKRTKLSACIGYDSYDICLACADKISEQLYPPREDIMRTLMRLEQFRPSDYGSSLDTDMEISMYRVPTTNMEVSTFRRDRGREREQRVKDDDQYLTKMMTCMYKGYKSKQPVTRMMISDYDCDNDDREKKN